MLLFYQSDKDHAIIAILNLRLGHYRLQAIKGGKAVLRLAGRVLLRKPDQLARFLALLLQSGFVSFLLLIGRS